MECAGVQQLKEREYVGIIRVECAGVQQLKEREYMGTIQSCKVNADYAAVRFDGRVNIHVVCISAFTHLALVRYSTVSLCTFSKNVLSRLRRVLLVVPQTAAQKRLSLCFSVYFSLCFSVYFSLSVSLSTSLSVSLSTSLSVSLSTSLSVFLSVCLSDFLSVITMEGILLVMCISHGMRLELGSHSGKILIDDALFSLDFALTRLFSQDYV